MALSGILERDSTAAARPYSISKKAERAWSALKLGDHFITPYPQRRRTRVAPQLEGAGSRSVAREELTHRAPVRGHIGVKLDLRHPHPGRVLLQKRRLVRPVASNGVEAPRAA